LLSTDETGSQLLSQVPNTRFEYDTSIIARDPVDLHASSSQFTSAQHGVVVISYELLGAGALAISTHRVEVTKT
jgi:hypothetical protein